MDGNGPEYQRHNISIDALFSLTSRLVGRNSLGPISWHIHHVPSSHRWTPACRECVTRVPPLHNVETALNYSLKTGEPHQRVDDERRKKEEKKGKI